MSQYCVIIGDLVRSRLLPDRTAVQNQLRDVLSRVSAAHSPAFAAPLRLTAGDEFQGVLCDHAAAGWVLLDIVLGLDGTAVRFGLGLGGIVTAITPDAAGMDGPAFHRARVAIALGSRRRRVVMIETGDSRADAILEALTLSLHRIVNGWTPRQRTLLKVWRKQNTETEIAAVLDVNRSTVNRTLHRAHAAELKAVCAAIPLAMTVCRT